MGGGKLSEPITVRAAAREFATADDRRAWSELTITVALYVGALLVALSQAGNWIVMIPAMLIASVSGLRAYMIQHDCFHHAFFTAREMNRFWGRILSVISLSPYETTREIHNLHHSYVSDLDHRETFEVPVMTIREWERATPNERLVYRICRHPITLIFLGPFILFGIVRRFPVYGASNRYGDLILHNLMLAAVLIAIWQYAGWVGIATWVAIFYIGSLGSLVNYVVHNFEEIEWGVKPDLDFEAAALKGSSVLDWGWGFDLALMNIGYHDLHHLNAKIPGYKLKEAHKSLEARGLLSPTKISFLDSVRCLRWKLYDEDNKRMVQFPKRTAGQKIIAAE